jgi:hypothetical protein
MPIKVENEPALIRDTHSKAIVNTDASGYLSYLSKKQKFREEKERIHRLEQDVNSLKQDLSQIKQILIGLVDTINTKK